MAFGDELLAWYHQNARDLPWRKTTDPYWIWLSEVILQQTRVEQGLPYFQRFTTAFPTLKKLASASEEEVLRLWQGLGYYSRGRNLLFAAKQMMDRHGGFPTTYEAIRNLKGIGDYTAAAVSSFAYGLPHAVVDGNVYRFYSRYFGIATPIDSTQGKKEFASLAQELLNKEHPALHNQAVMEFGAVVCKPKPDCTNCPFTQSCVAYKGGLISALPVKSKSLKTKDRYFNYLLISNKDKIYIRRREQKDIWQGLYEFPLIETQMAMEPEEIYQLPEWNEQLNAADHRVEHISKIYQHKLSHQTLYTRFFHLKYFKGEALKDFKMVRLNELDKYGMPQLLVKYLKEYK